MEQRHRILTSRSWILGGLAMLLTGSALFGCGGTADDLVVIPLPGPTPTAEPSPSPGPAPDGLEVRRIRPSETAAGLDDRYGEHRVYWPSNLLIPRGAVVFLPASGLFPANYEHLMQFAAEQRQVVIGLAYVNEAPVNELCPPDLATLASTCHGDVRAEVTYGEPRSDKVDVSPAESIEGRLFALLEHLRVNERRVLWGRLLDGERPRWSILTLAGHSQGGGHAAFVAQREAVHRAVMLSATEPARWTEPTEATPRSAFFGFAHVREMGFGGIQESWERLQLPGALTEVDAVLPEVPESQRLFTVSEVCDRNENTRHGCTSQDLFLPRDEGGELVFAPVFEAWFAPR